MDRPISSLRRLGTFFGAVIAGVVVWVLVLLAAFRLDFSLLSRPEQIPQPVVLTYTIGLYLWLMVLVALMKRPMGSDPALHYGFRFDGRLLIIGWSLGLGGVILLMGLELATGIATFRPPTTWPLGILAGSLLTAMAYAVSEELLFRGLFLRTLLLDHPPIRAIALSSVIFAALHFLRPNLGIDDLIPFLGLVVAGGVLAYAAWKTSSLWLPIGIHAGWVFFISLSDQLHLWEYLPQTLWLTGGRGPSSGLLGVVLLLGLLPAIKRHG
ncbi:CAAX amino terminal protease self- immunity [compost metagenome]